jgi:prepilin peptidase CpaA
MRHVLHITGPSFVSLIFLLFCSSVMLVASLHDIAARTIPNQLALALVIAGISASAIGGHLFGSLAAASGVFALSAVCWRRGWMGGGDVKLLGAASVGMPAGSVLTFIAAVAMAGGVLALFYLLARQLLPFHRSPRPNGMLARVLRAERWRISRGGPLPYACAITAGAFFIDLFGRMS